MSLLTIPECKYWIVSFSLDDAHIVEANNSVDILKNTIRTLWVQYQDLRHKYLLNIDEEAQKITQGKKSDFDPRILLNPNTTVDDLLALPQLKGRENKREDFAVMLKVAKFAPEYILEKVIREYDEAQRIPQEELYIRIKAELEQKRNYVPKQIRNLTFGELAFVLPQAGYGVGQKGFVTLDQALDELYYAWKELRDNFNAEVGTMDKEGDLSRYMKLEDEAQGFFEEN
ncbi:MAG: hypothetical protein Q8R47_06280 [Nanoarchaeota archaeon]|nr:hypothetical protein [Nanoarchaeota archaeon]